MLAVLVVYINAQNVPYHHNYNYDVEIEDAFVKITNQLAIDNPSEPVLQKYVIDKVREEELKYLNSRYHFITNMREFAKYHLDDFNWKKYQDYKTMLNEVNNWFPYRKSFNEKLVNFLEEQKIHNQQFFQSMLSKEGFVRHIPSYLCMFYTKNPQDVLQEVNNEIYHILLNIQKLDDQSATNTFYQIEKSTKIPLIDFIYDSDQFLSRFNEIHPVKVASKLDDLKEKLNFWFPALTKSNSIFTDFLRAQNVQENIIDSMSQNQNIFQNESKSFIQDFLNTNPRNIVEVRNEIYNQISSTAMKSRRNNFEIQDTIKFMKQKQMISDEDVKKVYETSLDGEPVLMEKFVEAQKKLKELEYERILSHLQSQITLWIPNNENFVNDFMNYLKQRQVSTRVLSFLQIEKSFKSEHNEFLKSFVSENKNKFNEIIYGKIGNILRQKYPKANEEKLKKIIDLLIETDIKDKFTHEMLFDVKINELVDEKIQELKHQKCLSMVNESIVTALKSQPNNRVAAAAAAAEICHKNDRKTLELEIEPYVNAAQASDDRFDKNSRIKNKTDELIYILIRKLLIKKSVAKADCI